MFLLFLLYIYYIFTFVSYISVSAWNKLEKVVFNVQFCSGQSIQLIVHVGPWEAGGAGGGGGVGLIFDEPPKTVVKCAEKAVI